MATWSLPESRPVANSEAQKSEKKCLKLAQCDIEPITLVLCPRPAGVPGDPSAHRQVCRRVLVWEKATVSTCTPSCPGESEQHDNISSLNLVFLSFLFFLIPLLWPLSWWTVLWSKRAFILDMFVTILLTPSRFTFFSCDWLMDFLLACLTDWLISWLIDFGRICRQRQEQGELVKHFKIFCQMSQFRGNCCFPFLK